MLSSLKLTTLTPIGRDEQKKLTLMITFLVDQPQSVEFLQPVDWQQLQLLDYPSIVKHPMNLLKIDEKLKAREYRSVQEMLDHIQLVWDNCKAYNPQGHYFHLADKMERTFKKMIRNYLPNINVVVPKPANSHTPTVVQPPIQQTVTKSQTRNYQQSSIPVVSKQIYQSEDVEEAGDNIAQIEQVPQSQKNRFHQRLKQLTQQQLAQIICMIQEGCPQGFRELGGGRSQIHLDNVDSETFKKLSSRVDELLEGDKGGSKKIKV